VWIEEHLPILGRTPEKVSEGSSLGGRLWPLPSDAMRERHKAREAIANDPPIQVLRPLTIEKE
jgi:hypothetical protein